MDNTTFSTELIKMVPVITGAIITGLITFIISMINHYYSEKKDNKKLKLQKIEEVSRELNEYHTFVIKQILMIKSTGNMEESEDKNFHIVTLLSIYFPSLLERFNEYTKEVQKQINTLMKQKNSYPDMDQMQKLYSDLIKSISDEARKLVD